VSLSATAQGGTVSARPVVAAAGGPKQRVAPVVGSGGPTYRRGLRVPALGSGTAAAARFIP